MAKGGPGFPLFGASPFLALSSEISPVPGCTPGLITEVASLLPGTPPARQMGSGRLRAHPTRLRDLDGSETARVPELLHRSVRTPGRTKGHLQK